MFYTGVLSPIEPVSQWTIPEKNPNGEGGVDNNSKKKIKKKALEIPKRRLHPKKFHKTVLHPSEVLRAKTKTPGYST